MFDMFQFTDGSLQGENIILLQLDSPTRTTRDYEGPVVSPMIQAAIENAMKDEEHLELDAKWAISLEAVSFTVFILRSAVVADKRKKKK